MSNFSRMLGMFSRQPEPVVTATPPAPAPRPCNAIADVQLMGSTAVATLTVMELAADQGAALLADLLDDLAATGAQHFVLDIQNVQQMDSQCLGCLVEATNRLAARGGKIALVNASHSVSYLFRLTRLDRVFPICPDVMAALNAVEREENARRSA